MPRKGRLDRRGRRLRSSQLVDQSEGEAPSPPSPPSPLVGIAEEGEDHADGGNSQPQRPVAARRHSWTSPWERRLRRRSRRRRLRAFQRDGRTMPRERRLRLQNCHRRSWTWPRDDAETRSTSGDGSFGCGGAPSSAWSTPPSRRSVSGDGGGLGGRGAHASLGMPNLVWSGSPSA